MIALALFEFNKSSFCPKVIVFFSKPKYTSKVFLHFQKIYYQARSRFLIVKGADYLGYIYIIQTAERLGNRNFPNIHGNV